ncbi:glycosyltransferase family 39 protein [Candidatus Pyrohabitans sp.]
MLAKSFRALFYIERREFTFLLVIYLLGLGLRLLPRLSMDPHMLTFQGDVWYRLAMAQYILDYHSLPEPDLRYRTYGYVPLWYPPLSLLLLALGSSASGVDLPTLCSRVLPFLEASTPLSIYFLARFLAGRFAAAVATLTLALTPSFVFWSGIADPQSFTLFALPLYLLYWMWCSAQRSILKLVLLGIVLGVNFLLHLSYFIVLLSLLMVTLGLIIRREAGRSLLIDLLLVIAISQAVAALWWLPRDLYWWWINALVTSSGMYPVERQLAEYGTIAALLGFAGMLYLLLRHPRRHSILLLWALPLFLETQNETILHALGRVDLTWHTLAKPLEGFRFYPFLAQPVAIAVGILVSDTLRWVSSGERWRSFALVALAALLLFGIYDYNLDSRFQATGLVPEEYNAALWFRDNTGEEAKIIADYYRAQMFAGVTSGRALLGGMFPLRNVEYAYIKAPGQVQNDIYVLYNTSSPEQAWRLARRYNATHIFYSRNMEVYGNLLSYFKPASEYGVDINLEKFEDERYFTEVYDNNRSGLGEVRIYKIRAP